MTKPSPQQALFNLMLTVLLRVYLVMLMLGVLHSAYPAVPALGFGTSAALYALSGLLFKTTSDK